MQIKFSIILPCYNEYGNLKLLIPEILNIFKNRSFEILVIDDNSSDQTITKLKNHFSKNPRIKYILSFWTLIDLIAIIPFFLSGINETFLLRLLRLIRLFSVIRIGRYSTALKNVLEAISDRKHELLFAVAISTTVLIISSTFMYLLEAEKQPEVFGSIIRSVWWAAAALTTVGYGDVYPITALGKIFAVISAFSSIGIVALPAGILAGSFTEKFKKKNKK